MKEYGISLVAWKDLPDAHAIVAAVPHKEYLSMPHTDLLAKLKPGRVFVDLKSAMIPMRYRQGVTGCGDCKPFVGRIELTKPTTAHKISAR